MGRFDRWRTYVATGLPLLLCVGSAYSGAATVRLYTEALQKPAVAGPFGTLNAFLKPVNLSTGEPLSVAVQHANWPADAEVLVLAEEHDLSRQELYQVYYSISYVLYPRRVWLASPCDARRTTKRCKDVSGQHSRYLVVIGANNGSQFAWHRPITDKIALAEMR
jgi:hypothetical protein